MVKQWSGALPVMPTDAGRGSRLRAFLSSLFFVNTHRSPNSKSQRCYIGIFLAAECTFLLNLEAVYHSRSQSLVSSCSLSLPFDLSRLVILFLYNAVALYITMALRDNLCTTAPLNHPCVSDNRSRLLSTPQLFVSTCKSSPPLHR